MPLDVTKVPASLVSLLPLAEQWAMCDCWQRDQTIEKSTRVELAALVQTVGSCDELFRWLAGPEAESQPPSDEYVAFSNLVDAFDYAKTLLERP